MQNIADSGMSMVMTAVSTFLIIAAIMAMFVPFWVYLIKKELIGANKRLDELIKLGGGNPVSLSLSASKKLKKCPKCGTANRIEESSCVKCGGSI